MHVHADVYLHVIFAVSVAGRLARSSPRYLHQLVQILFRWGPCALHPSHPARTSTRIPILSPWPAASAANVTGFLQVALSKIHGESTFGFSLKWVPPRISDQRYRLLGLY